MKIGIITDIHENMHRLEDALRLAGIERCDKLACLGDITGFDARFYSHRGRNASGCIRLIRENFTWVTAGNHDLHAVRRLPSYTDGFVYPSEWFDLSPFQRKNVSMGKVWSFEGDLPAELSDKDEDYLRNLPESAIVEVSGQSFLLSHYIYPDLTGSTTLYIERDKDLNRLKEYMTSTGITCSFSGHSHNTFTGFAYPGNRSFRKAVFNIPSDRFRLNEEKVAVFLPPLSGEASAGSFAVFDTDELILRILRVHGG